MIQMKNTWKNDTQYPLFKSEEMGAISLADVIEAFYDCLKRKRGSSNAMEFEMDMEANCLEL